MNWEDSLEESFGWDFGELKGDEEVKRALIKSFRGGFIESFEVKGLNVQDFKGVSRECRRN